MERDRDSLIVEAKAAGLQITVGRFRALGEQKYRFVPSVRFATRRGENHVRISTAMDWATEGIFAVQSAYSIASHRAVSPLPAC